MKGRLGYPGLLSYVHTMKKIIAKITWISGDETCYGVFKTMDDFIKWAEESEKEDGDVIETITPIDLYIITEDFEEQN
jgi:hypothetical protein